MFYYPFSPINPAYLLTQQLKENTLILDFKYGDVTGDGVFDIVYLIGEKNFGEESSFIENIRLVIIDGATYFVEMISFESDGGYNPRLFLGDFTGNKVDDILISIFSGGSGGMSWYYIFSYLNNKVKKLFDYEVYNNEYKYQVNYQDNYKVEVISENLMKKYIIDIQDKGEEYLSKLYDENGKLKEPIQGYVNPLSGLYPIDYNGDRVYELFTLRRVIGLYNADSLGVVQTSLQWKERDFQPWFEYLAVYGSDIKEKRI
ncbi:spore coat protein [Clostridium grantii]|uniref:Repeat domain-containing protein n=1 Tax=Clostridium grantii DSM 8605 TaxID=1121316 RepID=A0A1M5WU94_9CLOT|nr:spore coat protein [Clostridium grantii]SHH90998.1 hypothetical protein SAMN02745207_03127 [Clostridium grantii DSM 8605]